MTSPSPVAAATIRLLDRVCLAATLLCPLFLLHGRGVAEALIDVVAAGFLLRSGIARDWRWLHTPWVPFAAIWWGWLTICSVPVGPFGAGGWPGLFQAMATARFLLFAAALQHRVLAEPGPRRLMRWLLVAACLYIASQILLQAVTGRNLFGNPRFHDGTLTGPYDKPRAAAPLSRLLLPVMLAASAWMARQAGLAASARRWLLRAGSLLPLLGGLAVMVLAGQRMPMLLTLLGLLVAGLLLRRLRLPLLLALAAAPLLVAASAIVSPGSFRHLVLLFGTQMGHFGQSPYGMIYTRALSIALSNPLTGLGFDAFRNGCPDPAYFRDWPPWGVPAGDGGGAAVCVQHAHNLFLQALTDAGVPGLALFCVMAVTWLTWLARRLGRAPRDGVVYQAWRVGLFASVFIHLWPIASSSAFTNLPLGGWFFLLLGVGLAEAGRPTPGQATARAYIEPNQHSEADHG